MSTRTSQSIKTIFTSVIGQIIITVLSFLNRSVFLAVLGITYASINGLFLSIISVLSLAELGIGDAIIYSMYKPIANGDNEKIKSLLKFYKKAYKYIGSLVAIIGIMIIPFINYLIPSDEQVNGLIMIYILFLLNSVASYIFTYKRAIIIANQQGYINYGYVAIFNCIKSILQIILLLITKSFIIYLIIQIISTLITNIVISKRAEILHPYIKEKANELDKKESKDIFENIKALAVYKIGGILMNSTDNIIITKFVGLDWVGYISNYNLIIASVNMVLINIFCGIRASVGNLVATESDSKKYFMFKVINFINFWIFSFSSVAILILSNRFIKLWIGKEYVIDWSILFVLVINFYLVGMQNSIEVFREATGMFKETKFIILITSTINLSLSYIFSINFGVIGVFLATTISILVTNVWYEPFILLKKYFNVSLKNYILNYLRYIMMFLFICFTTLFFSSFIKGNSIFDFIKILILVCLIPNLIIIIINFRSEELIYIKNLILNKIKKLSN
ncbi:lipopolysaccharide biosynthesis protein [Clostridium perfringens]|uniref:lipopolysaccharide biosynthesis protein n=1 Tax=Clostridium perfringens TaxID=1502 RepID=UPI002A64C038|nr:sugar translocase [Clostridium perfringens]MDJ8935351.1 sugar translocase [Clostridium perfringens]